MSDEQEPIEVDAEVVPAPGSIPAETIENFKTLQRALAHGHVALVSALRKEDKERKTLICAMSANEDGTITPVPLAEMIESDPFKIYEDPTL